MWSVVFKHGGYIIVRVRLQYSKVILRNGSLVAKLPTLVKLYVLDLIFFSPWDFLLISQGIIKPIKLSSDDLACCGLCRKNAIRIDNWFRYSSNSCWAYSQKSQTQKSPYWWINMHQVDQDRTTDQMKKKRKKTSSPYKEFPQWNLPVRFWGVSMYGAWANSPTLILTHSVWHVDETSLWC